MHRDDGDQSEVPVDGNKPRMRPGLPRHRLSRADEQWSSVIQPDRSEVAVVDGELRAQVRLAEQLDLVRRIPALPRLDGLKGEPRERPATVTGPRK
jgi:hypothetical protein